MIRGPLAAGGARWRCRTRYSPCPEAAAPAGHVTPRGPAERGGVVCAAVTWSERRRGGGADAACLHGDRPAGARRRDDVALVTRLRHHRERRRRRRGGETRVRPGPRSATGNRGRRAPLRFPASRRAERGRAELKRGGHRRYNRRGERGGRTPTPAAGLQGSGSGGRPSGMSYKPIAPAPATPGAASASPAPPGPGAPSAGERTPR